MDHPLLSEFVAELPASLSYASYATETYAVILISGNVFSSVGADPEQKKERWFHYAVVTNWNLPQNRLQEVIEFHISAATGRT